MPNRSLLVLFFHPRFEESRAQKALVHALRQVENVTFRDMYELYPNFAIDAAQEQEELLRHDVVVWQHPIYWYNCPPLMKQWIDVALEYGWAYGKNGDKLRGKWIMNAASSGGTFEAYRRDGRNRFTYREFLSSFDQTAHLCQMRYLPPFIVPGANAQSLEELAEYGARYARLARFLQNAPAEQMEQALQSEYFNDFSFE
jgi:glutathione-regulated potassium-efflux system ancillary protein KefG